MTPYIAQTTLVMSMTADMTTGIDEVSLCRITEPSFAKGEIPSKKVRTTHAVPLMSRFNNVRVKIDVDKTVPRVIENKIGFIRLMLKIIGGRVGRLYITQNHMVSQMN